ncbi:MAG: beta-ketoacyl-[acyl-carrier-protein] synthase family protein [Flavobacteriales bacterium]|nr:beta-ketoacyl-[acyl-carrier-protein] synthase family protein [Flavobacteriales bacterium]
MKIAVTGIGVISAIGNGAMENFSSLIAKRTGIGKAIVLDSALTQTHLFGEIALTDAQLRGMLGWQGESVSRTSLLSAVAIGEAIVSAGLSNLSDVGLVSATSVSGMDRSESFLGDFLMNGNMDSVERIITHDGGTTTRQVALHFGIGGPLNTISTACSSGVNAIAMGARMLRQGMIDRVIVGGTDGLCRLTANGFNSLMILDPEWCRPMSADRAGLNLGEGAAYLVLEPMEVAETRGAKILATVSGWANTNDAYHQTASSPDGDGAYRSMKLALEKAELAPSDISYINAHGTGTPNNDQSESIAIDRLFGAAKPPISSTKAYTGHTLAASGAIEAVFCVLALQHQRLLPNLNHSEPMLENDWLPVTEPMEAELLHVLSNSFGFGGNNSSVVISAAS